MFAANAPAAVVQQSSQSDVIEVVGTRAEQTQKIDRRTYRVKDTPHAAQQDSFQLLRGLPAVTITSDDHIMLLGAQGVTILVDGAPVHGDPIQYLRTLHGSDIERIEVITNPSAQYSAEGTGGIVNFILRKKRDDGLSGSANAEGSTLGSMTGSSTLRYKKGKWTYGMQAQGGQFRDRERWEDLRTVENAPGVAPTVGMATARSHFAGRFGFASGTITHDIDDKTSISDDVFGGAIHGSSSSRSDWRGLTPDFQSFSELQRTINDASYVGNQLNLDHRGKKEGESLQAHISIYENPTGDMRTTGNLSDGQPYSLQRRDTLWGGWSKIDWTHPIGKHNILSAGAEWTFQRRGHDYDFVSAGSDPSLSGAVFDRFTVTQSNADFWTTFQRQIGSWTVMPGFRVDYLSRTVSSPGLSTIHVDRTNIYPSFHLQHPLGKAVNLTVSYSRRIDRPDDEHLRPYAIVENALSMSEGNPSLLDQSVDSYEADLHYHHKKLDAGLIIYDHETAGLWSPSYSVTQSGVNVFTWINAGHQSDRGAEIDVSTPFLARVKANASLNLFDSRVPVFGPNGAGMYESFRYTGNATIEWDGHDNGDRQGDVAQAQLQYQSSARSFETRDDASWSLNLSWTHSLSHTLSLTASIDRLGPRHQRHLLIAPFIREDTLTRMYGPEFKLKIVKNFGNSKVPPPPSAPPPAIPH